MKRTLIKADTEYLSTTDNKWDAGRHQGYSHKTRIRVIGTDAVPEYRRSKDGQGNPIWIDAFGNKDRCDVEYLDPKTGEVIEQPDGRPSRVRISTIRCEWSEWAQMEIEAKETSDAYYARQKDEKARTEEYRIRLSAADKKLEEAGFGYGNRIEPWGSLNELKLEGGLADLVLELIEDGTLMKLAEERKLMAVEIIFKPYEGDDKDSTGLTEAEYDAIMEALSSYGDVTSIRKEGTR